MRIHRSLTRLVTAAAVLTALTALAGCGSDDDPKGTDSSSTDGTTAPSGDDETDTASGGLIDVCTKITEDDVATILGSPVTKEEVPGGGCNFTQEDPRDPSLAISASAYNEANGGFDAAISGVSAVLQGDDGGPVDGIGEEAYVKAGTLGGETLKGGGIVHVGGTLVQVTYLQGGDETADQIKDKVAAALTLAAGKI